MPVYSMTGYANVVASPPNGEADSSSARPSSISVEMRAVNGRFLDLSMRIPEELRSLEPLVRDLVSAQCRRGKIEVRINTQRESEAAWPQPQAEVLQRLAGLEATVRAALPQAQALSVHEALQWCRTGSQSAGELDGVALGAVKSCLTGLMEARAREGEKLVAILLERVQRLQELAAEAEPLIPAVIQRQQQRFLERWNEALTAASAQANVTQQALQERALNEAAAFAIRIDVAEELSRLRAHLDEVKRLLAKGGELGKRLDFLIQELHREANTLGSKSAALELTNVSVEMKVAIEQMREQVQNIE
ncbi:YicC/YloC family endoribonuclease [Roseateles sp.]|uniref:YicC/YloC family endoribonuclease n=1 Tax=Roseateles sp. TaxID=1971397 RepID=UPI00394F9FC1